MSFIVRFLSNANKYQKVWSNYILVLYIFDPSCHYHSGGRFFNRIKMSTAIGISTIPMLTKAGALGRLLAEDCGTDVSTRKTIVSVGVVDWSVESD
jgi:hypothetical protein